LVLYRNPSSIEIEDITTKDTKSTKEEKIIKIRCFFQSDCLFFVSFVRFLVNKKALLER